MQRFCRQRPAITNSLKACSVTLLCAFVAGCSSSSAPNTTAQFISRLTSGNRPVVSEAPATCELAVDPFSEAINQAMNAAILAQSAQSDRQWNAVSLGWIQAIERMQAVPFNSPKKAFAQKKVTEYLKNLQVAQQKTSTTRSQLPFNSFDNALLDEQLLLYLSYVEAVGAPDILIVGSSRALLGVDPSQLQQSLAAKGNAGLKIFNFGVNGATAQFVDLLVRQVLTPEQLPQMIVLADGVRAFNSGRTDKTYSALVSSPGYKSVATGSRPKLPPQELAPGATCGNTRPEEDVIVPTDEAKNSQPLQVAQAAEVEVTASTSPLPPERWLIRQITIAQANTQANTTYQGSAIDANGFLTVEERFSPTEYYKQKPRVAGRYDADYQPFSMGGQQATALKRLQAFAREKQIPLVVVNLPVTNDYLDTVRRSREQQFRQFMQQRASQEGFIFVDMGDRFLNQNEYFTDPSHLNRYGAAAVSSQLAAESRIPWPIPRPQ